MDFANQIQATHFTADNRISQYITVHANIEVGNDISRLLLIATHRIAEHQNFNNLRKKKLFILFSQDEKFTVSLEEHEVATHASFAFFSVNKLRKYGEIFQLVVITEELVHHFWDEEDEPTTKKIVAELVPEVRYDEENDCYLINTP